MRWRNYRSSYRQRTCNRGWSAAPWGQRSGAVSERLLSQLNPAAPAKTTRLGLIPEPLARHPAPLRPSPVRDGQEQGFRVEHRRGYAQREKGGVEILLGK